MYTDKKTGEAILTGHAAGQDNRFKCVPQENEHKHNSRKSRNDFHVLISPGTVTLSYRQC